MENASIYYRNHGPMTDSGVLAAKFDILPTEVAAVCEALPGMLIHRDMAAFLYGVILSPSRRKN